MRAGVEQDADHAIAATHQDDRAPRHASRSKIPWLWDFRGVASIEPALLKHAPLFERHDLGIREHAALHTKHPVLAVIEHQVIERVCSMVDSSDVSVRPPAKLAIAVHSTAGAALVSLAEICIPSGTGSHVKTGFAPNWRMCGTQY